MNTVVWDKTVIVTGAASGMGKACVDYLLKGNNRVLALDLDVELLEAAFPDRDAKKLEFYGGNIAETAACKAAVSAAEKCFGKIDALMHWAAIHSHKTWDEITAEHMSDMLTVNVTGAFLIAQATAKSMQKTGGGAMMLTGSTAFIHAPIGGRVGTGGPAYVTTKAAIVGMVRTLARALGPHNIRVNGIAPGVTQTPMLGSNAQEYSQTHIANCPLGRIGTAEELAEAGCLVISDASRFVSGEMINVNGATSFG